MRTLLMAVLLALASAFVMQPLVGSTVFARKYVSGAMRTSPTCATKTDDVQAELETVRKENEELKELQRLKEENDALRGGLALPKSQFFDRFFGSPIMKRQEAKDSSALSLLDEMDELIHSSTSLLGGLMNSMLSSTGFETVMTQEAKDDVNKVMDLVKDQLQANGELSPNVVVDPPASQSYYKETINGKDSTTVSLILRAHAQDDTNLSGIVRVHATIDDKANVNVDRLELNKNLLVTSAGETVDVKTKEKQAA